MKKKTFIVSDTSSFYESIHTEDSYSLFLIKCKYAFKGYRVWSFLWLSLLLYRLFKLKTYKGTNISFELYVPNTGQCTYWTPWMNFN